MFGVRRVIYRVLVDGVCQRTVNDAVSTIEKEAALPSRLATPILLHIRVAHAPVLGFSPWTSECSTPIQKLADACKALNEARGATAYLRAPLFDLEYHAHDYAFNYDPVAWMDAVCPRRLLLNFSLASDPGLVPPADRAYSRWSGQVERLAVVRNREVLTAFGTGAVLASVKPMYGLVVHAGYIEPCKAGLLSAAALGELRHKKLSLRVEHCHERDTNVICKLLTGDDVAHLELDLLWKRLVSSMVGESIVKATKLRSLTLTNLGQEFEPYLHRLLDSKECSLETLDLQYNYVGGRAPHDFILMTDTLRALWTSKTISCFKMTGGDYQPSICSSLAPLLRRNSTLTAIHLRHGQNVPDTALMHGLELRDAWQCLLDVLATSNRTLLELTLDEPGGGGEHANIYTTSMHSTAHQNGVILDFDLCGNRKKMITQSARRLPKDLPPEPCDTRPNRVKRQNWAAVALDMAFQRANEGNPLRTCLPPLIPAIMRLVDRHFVPFPIKTAPKMKGNKRKAV